MQCVYSRVSFGSTVKSNKYICDCSVTDKSAREKHEKAWGVSLPDKVGLKIPEMFEAAYEGEVKAMYILGENPVLTDPNANHIKEALKRLDFLVVQELFLTETAEYADVVLPGASFAECDGTFTNTERRPQRVRKAIAPKCSPCREGSKRDDGKTQCRRGQQRISGTAGETGNSNEQSLSLRFGPGSTLTSIDHS